MNTRAVTLDILERMLDRNLKWIAAADAKVGPLLAIATAMLGTLTVFFSNAASFPLLPIISLSACVVLLILAIVFLGTTVFPRLRGTTASIIYFGNIAAMSRSTYMRRIIALDGKDLFEDIAGQCHRNAQIAVSKHKSVRRAMAFLLASILPWLISIWQLWLLKN